MILISLGSVFDWPNPYWRISFFASFHQWTWKAICNFQGPYPRRNGKTFFLSLRFPPIFYRGMIQGDSCELFFCDIVLDSKRGNRVYRIIDREPWKEGRKSSWRTRRYNNNIVDAQQKRSPLPPACVASLSYQWFSYNEHKYAGRCSCFSHAPIAYRSWAGWFYERILPQVNVVCCFKVGSIN